MGIAELFLIGVGLSMDAFAVAVCKGLNMKKVDKVYCLVIALFFGGFQALMPWLGWMLGSQFEKYIVSVDHWIAFALLAFLGGKMVLEALKKEEEKQEEVKLDFKELFLLAVATSIDALAVGITFAFLNVNIVPAITLIGCTTFTITAGGVFIGNIFGSRFKEKAEILGGVILILIGVKILVEHLFF